MIVKQWAAWMAFVGFGFVVTVPLSAQEPKLRATMKGHTSTVLCVAFSKDGKTLASGGYDQDGHKIKLWDMAKGTEKATLQGHTSDLRSVAFSPDGKTLASVGLDLQMAIRLWDVEMGKERTTLNGHKKQTYSVAYSPDGKTLASGSFREIKLWDVATGKEKASIETDDDVSSLSFSPDGKTLASGGLSNIVMLWDVQTGKEKATLKGHKVNAWSVAYSPDGKTLASGSGDETIKLWDVATGKEKATLKGHTGSVNSVAYSPDGMTLASASHDKTIKLWDVATGKEKATLKGHTDAVTSVAYSQDGKTLASGSWDHTVKLWDITVANKVDPPKNFTNNIGMKFVWIPPGTFLMGSPKEEKKRDDNEIQHKVTLTKGFYMGVYTVTQEQWKEIMRNNPSFFKDEKNLPVNGVSWNDTKEFIKKLREKDKKPYRLPTEAEWEYACRAGTTTPFSFGETISTDQANYDGRFIYGDGKKGIWRKKLTPVGSFAANAFGLHDMHGNVMQWCQDWHAAFSPKDVVDPQGPVEGQYRVMRGSSWQMPPAYNRSACRAAGELEVHIDGIGFRLCFSVE